ncbi:MFS transporter [Parafrigoribacterium mesophilum]|uniref:MFS transporter n=1 Tax=Parafrigoribacterium mesophilum TaxID=433646 RepID=UPI0031FBEF7A
MYISLSDRPKDDEQPVGASRTGRRVSSVVVTLGVVSMLTDISSESVAAVLPLYITGVIGLSTIAYGFIDGLYQGVSAIVRIAAGWASDRIDRPKRIAFLGYAVSAIARVGLLVASSFAAITTVLAIDRLGKGVRTAPRDALVAASSHPANLGRSFGVHRMLDTIGAAVGPLLAFVILLMIPEGYSTVFVVSLAFAVSGVAVLGLLVPNKRPRAERAAAGAPREPFRWRQLNEPRLRKLLAAASLLGLLTIGDGFIYLVLQSRGAFAAEWFPLLYVGTNVAFLSLAIPLGRMADRVGRPRMFVAGYLALLAAYLTAAIPVTSVIVVLLCLLLLGVFYAATDGVLAALAVQFGPPSGTASAIAAAQTVVAGSRLLASTGFGFLWFFAGRQASVLIVAGSLAIVLPLSAMLLRTGKRVAA